MKNFKLLSLALAILGIMVATVLIGWFGFDRIAGAILSVGVAGFALYAASQLILFVVMGAAWWAIAPPGERRLPVFVWGRMVRDAAASCLPFSQLGGFVLGARAVTLHGVAASSATISTVVDLTDEFVAEILFVVIALIILLTYGQGVLTTTPLEIGVGAGMVACVVAVRMQRRVGPLFIRLGRRILGQWLMAEGGLTTDAGRAASEAALAATYSHTGRIAAGTLLHLAGWVGKGASSWIAFRLLGAPIGLPAALAIEGLLNAVLAAAFLVPGYAGIQEAGYAGVGALFGVTPEIALSVSLLRRARDLALGVPILLVWQWVEVRRLRGRTASA